VLGLLSSLARFTGAPLQILTQKKPSLLAFAVTCYTDEIGIAEATGAEMRLCVGPTHSASLDNDLIRFFYVEKKK
jgi:hypothetical protein